MPVRTQKNVSSYSKQFEFALKKISVPTQKNVSSYSKECQFLFTTFFLPICTKFDKPTEICTKCRWEFLRFTKVGATKAVL